MSEHHRIYITNLPHQTKENELEELLHEYEPLYVLIPNCKSGIAYAKLKNKEQVESIIKQFNGQLFHNKQIKIEKYEPNDDDESNSINRFSKMFKKLTDFNTRSKKTELSSETLNQEVDDPNSIKVSKMINKFTEFKSKSKSPTSNSSKFFNKFKINSNENKLHHGQSGSTNNKDHKNSSIDLLIPNQIERKIEKVQEQSPPQMNEIKLNNKPSEIYIFKGKDPKLIPSHLLRSNKLNGLVLQQ